MTAMKIAYVGTDLLYPALPALTRAGCDVLEVVSCETNNAAAPSRRVCDFAWKRGIPLSVGRLAPADLRRLEDLGCQAVICGGYRYRLPVSETMPMVNIHPALLPMGRSPCPMPVTILRGLPESGITLHKVTPELGRGDILLQKKIRVLPGENLQTLTLKFQTLLPGMMAELSARFQELWDAAVPQGKGESWPCPRAEDYAITPDTPFEAAKRILRAFYGCECVYQSEGKRYGLINAVVHPDGQGWFPVRGGAIQAEKVRELP